MAGSRHTARMASAAERRESPLIPARDGFLGLVVLGLIAVVVLPAIAIAVPHPGRAAQARYAATALGMLVITGGYLHLVAGTRSAFDRAWGAATLVYVAGLVIRAGAYARDALHAGAAIVVAHHLFWVLYMARLFS